MEKVSVYKYYRFGFNYALLKNRLTRKNKKDLLEISKKLLQNAFKLVEKDVEPAPLIFNLIDYSRKKTWNPVLQTFS